MQRFAWQSMPLYLHLYVHPKTDTTTYRLQFHRRISCRFSKSEITKAKDRQVETRNLPFVRIARKLECEKPNHSAILLRSKAIKQKQISQKSSKQPLTGLEPTCNIQSFVRSKFTARQPPHWNDLPTSDTGVLWEFIPAKKDSR